jgi:hypothetical protein
MWSIRETEEYGRPMKYFAKKHRNELVAMLDNLDSYLTTLQSGLNPKQIRFGLMHDETHGAIAIDQKGVKGRPTQTRLYIYPDQDTKTLYLITIGDKQSQREDNETCRKLILDLREQKENEQDWSIFYTDEIAAHDSSLSSRRISHALFSTLLITATFEKAHWSLQEISEELNGFLERNGFSERVTTEVLECLLNETSIRHLVKNESDMWRFKMEELEKCKFTMRDLSFLNPNAD